MGMKLVSLLARQQLDRRLQEEPRNPAPPQGWIRTVREALGMSATQLARKMGIKIQSLRVIEESEKKGTISLSTLTRAANAMNCEVKVCFLPNPSLDGILKKQALEAAQKIHERTALHMSLEDQATSSSFRENQVRETADDLIRNLDRRLWES